MRPLRETIVCLALICMSTAAAQGHAYVVASSPATNGTLAAPPHEVSVSFDEPVTVEPAQGLVVRGEDGTTYACTGGARVDADDETLVVCNLAARLPRGAYTVSWRVTSADTHVVHGIYSFGVGVAVNGPSGEVASIYDPSGALATVLRWLVLVGVAMVAGASAFEIFVSPASVAVTLRTWGVWVALAASVVALDVQGAAASGSDLLRAIPELPRIAAGSTWGLAWLVRTSTLVLILALGGRRAVTALVLAGISLLTLSVSGHAIATGRSPQTVLSVASDWLHLAAAAVWAGGLAVFAAGFRAEGSIARFSVLALGAVAAIALTGTYASVVHVGSFQALTGSTYGRIVLAKIGLLFILLFFGYEHLRQGRGRPARLSFAVTVICEAAIVLVVIGLSALLTGLAPPYPNQGG